jgi:hypothetical protein
LLKNFIESVLLESRSTNIELSGVQEVVSVDSDNTECNLINCLLYGGDWVIKDIRNQSGEYCMSHDSLETHKVREDDPLLG